MTMRRSRHAAAHVLVAAFAATLSCAGAQAENLFSPEAPPLIADRKAARIGDALIVVVYQSAEARNAARNVSRKRRTFEGDVRAGEVDESARLDLDGAYDGAGEISRSESLVTQMSVLVEDVLANGDLRVAGVQQMRVNGETTTVRVRGRVRPTDISGDNRVLSTRIADAEIDYGGRGFVSRSARPGFVHRVFSLLGLGG